MALPPIQLLHSTTAGNRPIGKIVGEAYGNLPDRAFGMVDNSGNPVDFMNPGMRRGYVNRFMNPGFNVWQRGASISVPVGGARIADCWLLYPTGATVTASAAQVGNYRSKMNLSVGGAAGLTSLTLRHRIESYNVAEFQANPFTIQIKAYQNSGATITPTVSIAKASAMDNFSTVTGVIGNTNLQSLPNATWTQLAYSFPAQAMSALSNGIQIDFIFPATLGAGTQLAIAEADIRMTYGIPTGLNANPPTAELRTYAEELLLCQRYFETSYPQGTPPGGITSAGADSVYYNSTVSANYIGSVSTKFKVTKRATPTIVLYSPSTGASGKVRDSVNAVDVTPSPGNVGDSGFYWAATAGASTIQLVLYGHWTASAEQ